MNTDDLSVWDDARRLIDELETQIHLASMDARDRLHELEPRLGKLEKTIAHATGQISDVVVHELHDVRDALRALRDEVQRQVHGN